MTLVGQRLSGLAVPEHRQFAFCQRWDLPGNQDE